MMDIVISSVIAIVIVGLIVLVLRKRDQRKTKQSTTGQGNGFKRSKPPTENER